MPPENSRLRYAILNLLANEPDGKKPSQIISRIDESLAAYVGAELKKMVADGYLNEASYDYCLPEFFRGMVQKKIAMLQVASKNFLQMERGDENFDRHWEYLEGCLEHTIIRARDDCPKS